VSENLKTDCSGDLGCKLKDKNVDYITVGKVVMDWFMWLRTGTQLNITFKVIQCEGALEYVGGY
jgi:hypothetical protein